MTEPGNAENTDNTENTENTDAGKHGCQTLENTDRLYTSAKLWPSPPPYGIVPVRDHDFVIRNDSDLVYLTTHFDHYIETYPDHGDADALRAAQGRFRDAMANMPECTASEASRYLWKSFFREVRSSMSPKTAAAEKARGVPWNTLWDSTLASNPKNQNPKTWISWILSTWNSWIRFCFPSPQNQKATS
jgi:hypothetical protein